MQALWLLLHIDRNLNIFSDVFAFQQTLWRKRMNSRCVQERRTLLRSFVDLWVGRTRPMRLLMMRYLELDEQAIQPPFRCGSAIVEVCSAEKGEPVVRAFHQKRYVGQ